MLPRFPFNWRDAARSGIPITEMEAIQRQSEQLQPQANTWGDRLPLGFPAIITGQQTGTNLYTFQKYTVSADGTALQTDYLSGQCVELSGNIHVEIGSLVRLFPSTGFSGDLFEFVATPAFSGCYIVLDDNTTLTDFSAVEYPISWGHALYDTDNYFPASTANDTIYINEPGVYQIECQVWYNTTWTPTTAYFVFGTTLNFADSDVETATEPGGFIRQSFFGLPSSMSDIAVSKFDYHILSGTVYVREPTHFKVNVYGKTTAIGDDPTIIARAGAGLFLSPDGTGYNQGHGTYIAVTKLATYSTVLVEAVQVDGTPSVNGTDGDFFLQDGGTVSQVKPGAVRVLDGFMTIPMSGSGPPTDDIGAKDSVYFDVSNTGNVQFYFRPIE